MPDDDAAPVGEGGAKPPRQRTLFVLIALMFAAIVAIFAYPYYVRYQLRTASMEAAAVEKVRSTQAAEKRELDRQLAIRRQRKQGDCCNN